MLFDVVEQTFESPSLTLTCHLAPWDRPVFPGNTAAISAIRLGARASAAETLDKFRDWCVRNDVRLVSCRLDQDRLIECSFLESHGFRFIELNYRPVADRLDRFQDDPEIVVVPAEASDAAEISAFAARTFEAGRLHADPEISPEIGNRRYAAWVPNAFHHPGQSVYKILMHGRMIAYMVQEQPRPATRFWSFNGLVPGLAGQGLGRRAWRAMLAFNRREGAEEVSTSISSHNVAAFNLYVSLGFRFPAPAITLHWCPSGPVAAAP
jgi:RimJ/RimL family protein N-acetyltransferase